MRRIYKYTFLAFSAMASFCFASCSSDENTPSVPVPSAEGTYIDTRDGDTYHWVRYGSQEWMTENFRYNTGNAGCTIYQSTEDYAYDEHHQSEADAFKRKTNLPKYGRLYTYQQAQQACPEGWRIPTDDDWKNLEKTFGMSSGDAGKREWRGNCAKNMMDEYNDTTILGLRLGGFYDTYLEMGVSNWRMFGIFGFYWTSTQDEDKASLGEYYFYRKIAYNKSSVYRESMEKDKNQISLRLVRDAQ